MADIKEIDAGIGAHGMWKGRLLSAITGGKMDTPVATVQADNECAFGKWLYGSTLTAADKTSADYKSVKELHAQFHKAAGKVAGMAVAGRKAEATALMLGEFSTTSSALTMAMMNWKKSLK